jgi:HAE1 family hydrophobic/amphiphilic exporter-1
MLAARLPVVAQRPGERPGRGARLAAGYGRVVGWSLGHQGVIVLVFVLTTAASAYTFTTIPRSFFPSEDIGALSITATARQDISYAAMKDLTLRAQAVIEANPAVLHAAAVLRDDSPNRAGFYVQLQPRPARPALAQTLSELRASLGGIAGLRVVLTPSQSLRFGARSTQSQYQVVVQSIDAAAARDWAGRLANAMRADTAVFSDIASDDEDSALTAEVVVVPDAAQRLGVSAESLRAALEAGFGSYVATQIQTTGSSYDVILEYDPGFAWEENALAALDVPTASGAMVPLSAFARVVRSYGPVAVNQTGQLTSVTLSFNLPAGVSLGTATARVEAIQAEIGLPATVVTSYAGAAALFQQASGNTGLLIAAAVLTIYIVLGILYESFLHPLTVLSGLPSAALGALLALRLAGMDLSIIALIGLLMLIGIVKKNAIMMIDVALELQRAGGHDAVSAIRIAAERRFRPIMMTTFCALLGALPIALGTGASSELRQPLGIAVVGGLLLSQALTLVITPVIFVQLDRAVRAGRRLWGRRPKPRHAES